MTALLMAVRKEDKEMIQLLLSNGAIESVNIPDNVCVLSIFLIYF
jgi:ankyrin repeat protein